MKLLAIESSCDDASAAILEENDKTIKVLEVKNFSQSHHLARFGGVVPEVASRGHVGLVFKAAKDVINKSKIKPREISAVAVTNTPGLIGPLLVGLNFAKGFAVAKNVPLVPVNHLKGHVASNYIENPGLEPPFICLVVSGGHTIIIDVRSFTDFRIIGETRDDAVGEVLDKIARKLGIPYPGGPILDRLSQVGDPKKFKVPQPLLPGFDFSFSGIKTWAISQIEKHSIKNEVIADFSASLCDSIASYLTGNLILAAQKFIRNRIAIAGGVASNYLLRKKIKSECEKKSIQFFCPSKFYCSDNAAMIGVQAFHEFNAGNITSLDINAYSTSKNRNGIYIL
jgi:N6-L-threonylcarbamoyladenine synthase